MIPQIKKHNELVSNIMEYMKNSGCETEVLLLEMDEEHGEWRMNYKRLDALCPDYPYCMYFEDENAPDYPTYRIVRLGVIDGQLKMRVQRVIEENAGKETYEPENEEWWELEPYKDYLCLGTLEMALAYAPPFHEYTLEHPELCVLGNKTPNPKVRLELW